MCGICGQYNFVRQDPVQSDVIRRMAKTIVHRGPDDEGYFVSGPIGLGFRRLSIIDLAGGHQPMSDEKETVWVVLNGEIYNFKELRTELEERGHRFRTKSDTEVVLHGYREWGAKILNRLNGMFGLAIWDVKNGRLIVARDAMGIKPVYYRVTDGALTFGSEIRAVLAAIDSVPDIEPIALHLFLRFRYTPSPLTMFQGIRKLAPGEMLVVESGRCAVRRWYNYAPIPFEHTKTDDEAVSELMELYRGAVKRHLLSDVPVGILLSGGLDSGLLLALMREHGANWPAYTVGYGDVFEDDELKDAAETARLLGAGFVPVQLDRGEFEESLAKIVDCLEEPVTSSSIVPMYFVCQRARQDVKVALIGQGPDELFGGYTRHLGVNYGRYWRGLPSPIRSLIGAAVNGLPRNEALKRGVQSLGTEDRLERYHNVFSLAPVGMIDQLFQEGVLPPGGEHETVNYWRELSPQMAHLDELGGLQLLEVRSSLPDELLMFGDKVSMAHSIEVRVPYLDRTVVEYAQRLGASFMIRGRERKWVHRQICQKFLPPEIVQRKKRGFAVNVVDGWLNSAVEGKLTEMLRDEQSVMYRHLRRDVVLQLLDAHRSGRADHYKLLFSLVVVEQWLRGLKSRGTVSRSEFKSEESQRERINCRSSSEVY